jgi:hypothetical protein
VSETEEAGRGSSHRSSTGESLKEWGFGLFLALVSSLPHLYLWIRIWEPGFIYGWGIPPYPEDVLAYAAWVKQAADGAWLFVVKYTAIAQEPQIVQPYFWAVGQLQRMLASSPGFALFVARAVAVAFFGKLLFVLLRQAGVRAEQRWGAALLIGFATGVGGFFVGEGFAAADLWVVDLNVFWSLAWNGLFAFALCLLVSVAILFQRGLAATASDRRNLAFLGVGVCLALLAFVHPYDVFVAACIGISLLVFAREGRSLRELAASGAWIAVPALPAGLYQLQLSSTHPVLSRHAQMGGMESPSPLSYVLGIGLPLVFAAIGALATFSKGKPGDEGRGQADLRWLVVWVGLCLVAAFLPIWFQRKMVFAIGIPIGVLASHGIERIAGSGPRRRIVYWSLIGVILVVSFAGSHRHNAEAAMAAIRSDPFAYFDSDAFSQVGRFLDRETDANEVVLADLAVSRSVPGRSGNTVIFGHWAQSVDLRERADWFKQLFSAASPLSDHQKRRSLMGSPVSLVLVDERLRRMMGGQVSPWLRGATRSIYLEGGYEVLRVLRD